MRRLRYYPYKFADPPGVKPEQVLGNFLLTAVGLVKAGIALNHKHQEVGVGMIRALDREGWTIVSRRSYDEICGELKVLRERVTELEDKQERADAEATREEDLPPSQAQAGTTDSR